MKKIFSFVAVAAALLVAGNANAQLGLHIGYAPQNYYGTTTTTVLGTTVTTHDTTNMTGFFVGADYNINLTGDLNVSLGLQGRYNTSSESSTLLGVTTKVDETQVLLDVPILFNYGLSLSDALKLSVFAGPTITYALSGNTKTTVSGTPAGILDGTTENNWYGDNSNLKKLDMAVSFGVAVTFSDIKIFGGYNMGLLNLTTADNTTYKGSNLFLGIGYNL